MAHVNLLVCSRMSRMFIIKMKFHHCRSQARSEKRNVKPSRKYWKISTDFFYSNWEKIRHPFGYFNFVCPCYVLFCFEKLYRRVFTMLYQLSYSLFMYVHANGPKSGKKEKRWLKPSRANWKIPKSVFNLGKFPTINNFLQFLQVFTNLYLLRT